MKWMIGEIMELICGRGKEEKPREKNTRLPFHQPQNPHGVNETQIWMCEARVKRMRHETAYVFLHNTQLDLYILK